MPFFESYKRAGSVVDGNCQLDPEEPAAGTSGVLCVGMHRFFCWKSPILVGNPGLFSHMNPANMCSIRTEKSSKLGELRASEALDLEALES